MTRTWLVALAVFVAGCAGSPTGVEESSSSGTMVHHVMQNVTFFEGVVDNNETFSGVFGAQDHGAVQGALATAGQPTSNVQSHDVSDLIPDGIPVFVDVEVTSGQRIYTWLGSDDFSAIWTSDCGDCEAGGVGTTWSGAVIDTGQALTVNAWYSQNSVPSEMPYEVTIRVRGAPDMLPTGIAVEVELPEEGSHILFEPMDGTMPDVLVFDPDDAFVGTLPGDDAQMRIEENQTTGAYVFLPAGHGSAYRLRSGGEVADGPLDVKARILKQDIRTTGPHEVTQDTEMTFELERQPLQMGISYFGLASQDAQVSLESPGGVRVEAGHEGFVAGGVGGFQQTVMGDPRLEPGTYTLTWSDTANDGSMQVQEFFTLYGR